MWAKTGSGESITQSGFVVLPTQARSTIERMYSRDQRPYLFNETKGSFYITKDFNSLRIDLGHQHGRLFIV